MLEGRLDARAGAVSRGRLDASICQFHTAPLFSVWSIAPGHNICTSGAHGGDRAAPPRPGVMSLTNLPLQAAAFGALLDLPLSSVITHENTLRYGVHTSS
jgi:hypothetical protein